jgi:hypothetical protein
MNADCRMDRMRRLLATIKHELSVSEVSELMRCLTIWRAGQTPSRVGEFNRPEISLTASGTKQNVFREIKR